MTRMYVTYTGLTVLQKDSFRNVTVLLLRSLSMPNDKIDFVRDIIRILSRVDISDKFKLDELEKLVHTEIANYLSDKRKLLDKEDTPSK